MSRECVYHAPVRHLSIVLCMLFLLPPCSEAARKWRTYEGCRLVPSKSNDGDSFHVKYKRKEYVFRLYFVDAPETDMEFEDRVKEQSEYWNIEPKEVPRFGKKAAKFTEDFLDGEFTVYTKRVDAMGRSYKGRFYAMVEKDGQFLSEALVRNGLARRHGVRIALPSGKSAKSYSWDLKQAEGKARNEGLGAWAGRSTGKSIHDLIAQRLTASEIEPQSMITPKTMSVYSTQNPQVRVGLLRKGSEIAVLGAEGASWVRISFERQGSTHEVLCSRQDLGL